MESFRVVACLLSPLLSQMFNHLWEFVMPRPELSRERFNNQKPLVCITFFMSRLSLPPPSTLLFLLLLSLLSWFEDPYWIVWSSVTNAQLCFLRRREKRLGDPSLAVIPQLRACSRTAANVLYENVSSSSSLESSCLNGFALEILASTSSRTVVYIFNVHYAIAY